MGFITWAAKCSRHQVLLGEGKSSMFRCQRYAQRAGAPLERLSQDARIVFQADAQALERVGVLVAAASDRGCVREQNEDYLGIYAPPSDIPQDVGLLAVLADGMGGHAAGEIASELAVSTIAATFYQTDLASDADTPGDGTIKPDRRLYAAFLAADRAIRRAGKRSPDRVGMGCTCIAAVLSEDEITLAHVGDTRAYLVQPVIGSSGKPDRRWSTIRQLTTDHSLAAELVRVGLLAEGEAQNSPRRHMVTRALGGSPGGPVCAPEIHTLRLRADDILVLCCDGLWSLVSDEQIATAVQEEASLDHACATLVELARQAGGKDNISLMLLAVR